MRRLQNPREAPAIWSAACLGGSPLCEGPAAALEGCGAASNTEFSRFLGFAYRSLKEAITALELCQRLYPSLPQDRTHSLIDEGNQISKMIYALMQKVDPGNHLR